jgi:HrpA-like RNA helicase
MKKTSQLPIYLKENEILDMIASNSISIVQGETGSGKTTQLPLMLAKKFPQAKIAITQPRRVAAVSLARRVAKEYGCKLGDDVGYSVRFDSKKCLKTRILFMTDGMLLREFLNDSKLSKYSILILDEVHERSLRTDVLLGLIMNLIKSSKRLKLVLMSATLDKDKLNKFLNAPIMEIPGRTFPISTFYSKETLKDPINSALITIFQIHQDYGKGDILVFLPGQEEILDLERLVIQTAKDLDLKYGPIVPLPFYAALPTESQCLVFDKLDSGARKVILATNIAETSITIPGISYVVDTGLVKVREYFPRLGMESLSIAPVSQASANQRKGRAGRVGPGTCFRLFTEDNFSSLERESSPEIKRVNISSVILLLKTLKVEDVTAFPYLDPPPRDAIVGALENLFILGALDEKGQVSKLGIKMASFPLDPVYSRILIESGSHGVVNEVASIIALLSIDSIFYSPRDKREEAAEAKKKFISFDGDHITLLNVLQEFISCKGGNEWCSMNFISYRSLKQVMVSILKMILGYPSPTT